MCFKAISNEIPDYLNSIAIRKVDLTKAASHGVVTDLAREEVDLLSRITNTQCGSCCCSRESSERQARRGSATDRLVGTTNYELFFGAPNLEVRHHSADDQGRLRQHDEFLLR